MPFIRTRFSLRRARRPTSGDVSGMIKSMIAMVAVLVLAVVAPLHCQAKGTMRVQRADGSVQTYKNVTIKVVKRTLRLTTADNKGTLVVNDAACSPVGQLLRCLPYGLVLEQNGTHPLDFDRGTIYFNRTASKQQLKYSSTRLEPHGILASFRSERGTYVSLTGEVDQ